MYKRHIRDAVIVLVFLALIIFLAASKFHVEHCPTRVAGISKITEQQSDMSDVEIDMADVVEVMECEPELDQADIELLARLMTAEQGYGADEKLYFYTGSVVLNRVASDRFPNTIREVVYQKNPLQYECTKNGHINRPYDDVAWEVAEALLIDGSVLPVDVVYQAEFKQGSGVYEQVGRTYFCYK